MKAPLPGHASPASPFRPRRACPTPICRISSTFASPHLGRAKRLAVGGGAHRRAPPREPPPSKCRICRRSLFAWRWWRWQARSVPPHRHRHGYLASIGVDGPKSDATDANTDAKTSRASSNRRAALAAEGAREELCARTLPGFTVWLHGWFLHRGSGWQSPALPHCHHCHGHCHCQPAEVTGGGRCRCRHEPFLRVGVSRCRWCLLIVAQRVTRRFFASCRQFLFDYRHHRHHRHFCRHFEPSACPAFRLGMGRDSRPVSVDVRQYSSVRACNGRARVREEANRFFVARA